MKIIYVWKNSEFLTFSACICAALIFWWSWLCLFLPLLCSEVLWLVIRLYWGHPNVSFKKLIIVFDPVHEFYDLITASFRHKFVSLLFEHILWIFWFAWHMSELLVLVFIGFFWLVALIICSSYYLLLGYFIGHET